jgi:hypothetical protein
MFSNVISFIAGLVVYHVIKTGTEQEPTATVLASVGVPEDKIPVKTKKKNAKVQGDSQTSV